MKTAVVLLAYVCYVVGIPPPHPDVLAVGLEEDFLPSYQKSQALRNPHLQVVLPLSSLLHKGENLVFNREAEKVSRKEIYKILTHAGFIARKNPHYRYDLDEPAVHREGDPDLFKHPFFQSQDFLQHL